MHLSRHKELFELPPLFPSCCCSEIHGKRETLHLLSGHICWRRLSGERFPDLLPIEKALPLPRLSVLTSVGNCRVHIWLCSNNKLKPDRCIKRRCPTGLICTLDHHEIALMTALMSRKGWEECLFFSTDGPSRSCL